MRKRKNILIGIIIFLVLVLVFIVIFKNRINIGSSVTKNKEEVEALVSINQAELSAFVFATQESPTDHRLHVNFTPSLSISIKDKVIKEFYIENFESNGNLGEGVLIHPTELSVDTVGRTFLFTEPEELMMSEDIVSEGNSIAYTVVPEVTMYNQVLNKGTITPYFGIILKDVASVNYQDILERDGVFEGSKYLEYSGIDIADLDTKIQFDIRILFEDGDRYVKRFKGTLSGETLQTEITPVITLQVE